MKGSFESVTKYKPYANVHRNINLIISNFIHSKVCLLFLHNSHRTWVDSGFDFHHGKDFTSLINNGNTI